MHTPLAWPGRRIAATNPSQKTGRETKSGFVDGSWHFPEGESMENSSHPFSAAERAAVYRSIFTRRDVRSQFLPDAIPDAVLSRVLLAAHHAPSVGFMQPWNFLLVRSPAVKQRVHAAFSQANEEAAAMFPDEKRQRYSQLKLQGILDAPLNLCITCDRSRSGPVVLGRTHMPSMDLYSSVCAVQNLWLAARAEGLGMGWVSIFDPVDLARVMGLPDGAAPIAILCLGPVSAFYDEPMLQRERWAQREPLSALVFDDDWHQTCALFAAASEPSDA